MRRARMPPDPAGLPIEIEPTGDTPRPRRCLPRTGRTRQPLTPLLAMRVRRSAARTARTTFPADPSKTAVPEARGAFHRRVPARPTPLARGKSRMRARHRPRDFAAPARLPTLLRPTLPEEVGLDMAASRRSSRPGAPCHAPLVDFCNRNDPQARPTGLRNPAPRRAARLASSSPSWNGSRPESGATAFDGRRSADREPRIHGSGAA